MKPLRLERDKKQIRLKKDLGSTPAENGMNKTRAWEDGMILDEDMTQNLRKELKELNEKNGEENDNLCHEWNRKQP